MALPTCNENGSNKTSVGKHFLLHGVALLAVFIINTTAFATGTHYETNPRTRMETWQTRSHGIFLSLTQITPDQAEAFFLARGFDQKSAELYASDCIFGTVFRNESIISPILVNLANWRIVTQQGERKLTLKANWERKWKARGISKSAQIAFHWSQFPTRQRFALGDWSQGMTTYALPRGSQFGLKFNWTVKGVTHEEILSGVTCATDSDSR